MKTTKALQKLFFTRAKAVGGPLETPTLMLIGAPFTEGNGIVSSDLTEYVGAGYAAQAALVYGTPYEGQDGKVRMTAPSVEFLLTAYVLDGQVHGWAVVNAAKTAVYKVHKYASPIPFDLSGLGLVVEPELVYGE